MHPGFSPEAAQMLEVRVTVRHKKLAASPYWRHILFHLSTEMSSRRDEKGAGK